MKTKITGFACLLASSLLAASPLSKNFPDLLIYHLKPIDPLCITGFETPQGDLATCDISAQHGLKISGYNNHLLSQGYTGFDYQENDSYPTRGYSYYKPYGMINDAAIVYSVSSGGGTGEFTSINLVRRHQDKITVKVINSGDRCNGGIRNVSRQNHHLTYSVSVTPFDFLTLAHDNPHHLKAYNDLLSCAACCAGKAVYARSDDDFNKEKLLYLNFAGYALSGWNGSPAQVCLDKLIDDYIKQGITRFDEKQLLAFTQQYNRVCFNQK